MIKFEFCDFNNLGHTKALTELLNHYMADPMGDYKPHDESDKLILIKGLSAHPTAEVLFIKVNNEYAGMATTFVNYSTFKLKPYLYIHDVVIHDNFRGKGLGKAIIEKLIQISRERGYCKLTLEVREDNPAALSVYKSFGFVDCDPKMYFWTKTL